MTSRLIQSLGLEPQYLEGCARVSVCALARLRVVSLLSLQVTVLAPNYMDILISGIKFDILSFQCGVFLIFPCISFLKQLVKREINNHIRHQE